MFTKKTRILSALVTVCMLISMLTCFVVPAVAEVTQVPTGEMENLNGITEYPGKEVVKEKNYVITDIQGMLNLANISQTKNNNWVGATIYLGADIDMGWYAGEDGKGYKGIGNATTATESDNGYYSFKGSFDGNGYVIKNLYINRPDEICVGLFNWYYGGSGGELRNIVIENGIVIGGANTGSLVGKCWNGTIMNCHSNAVVISDATFNGDKDSNAGFDANTNYVGGLVGQEKNRNTAGDNAVERQSAITDSSFSGTVLDCGVDVTDTVGIYSGGPKTASSIDESVVKAADSKTSGFHAWKLNSLVAGSFWKVGANGRVVEADEATQTRKLTVRIGENELEAYGSAGESVALSSLFDTDGATITPADGAAGSLEDGVFTFGAGDGEITAEPKANDADYQILKALYDRKPAYWDEKGIGTALGNIYETFTEGGYKNLAAMDVDIKAVAALFTADANDKVPASAAFDAVTLNCGVTIPSFATPADKVYKNIGIYDTQDLLYIEAVQSAGEGAKYAADQTIYLCTKELDLKGSTFSQIKDLMAGFDGQGNTIKNYSPEAVAKSGFFYSYDGPFVKNVVFDYDEGVTFASLGSNGGLVISDYQQHSGAAEGVLEDITICNANVSVTGSAGFALLVAQFGKGTFKVENILIENNTIDSTKKNNAMLAIRSSGVSTVDFTNITIRNNMFGENADNNSWLIVELNDDGAGSTWNFKNVLIHDNTIPGAKNTAVLMREYFSKSNPITVDFTNVMAFNNKAHYLACYRAYGDYITTNVMTAENVYVENGDPSRIRHYASSTSTYKTLEDLKDTTTMMGFASGTVLGEKADFAKGKFVYEANAKSEEFLLDNDGKIYLAETAPEGTAAPKKVAFVKGEEEKLSYYTVANGTLLAADADEVKALYECELLNAAGEETEAETVVAATYTENATFMLTDHIKSYSSNGNGTHTVSCSECDRLVPYQEDCTDADGKTVVAPDADVEGGDYYKCDDCSYEWIENNVGKRRDFSTQAELAVKIGGEVQMVLNLTNSPDLTDLTLQVEYDATVLEYVSNSLTNTAVDSNGVLSIAISGNTPVNVVNDVLAKITFKVKDTAQPDQISPVKVTISGVKANGMAVTTIPDAELDVNISLVEDTRGDLNGDGRNMQDVVRMLEHFSKDVNAKLSNDEKLKADMNDDNQFTIVDVLILLKELSAKP